MLGVVLLAAALRLYGIDRQSAWADEITTLFITDPTLPFRRFWDLVLSDTHPPLYYLVMRGWSEVAGQSDLAARIPSAIFGILTVVAAALAFKPLAPVGRLSLMLLLAVSPGAIEYAQEARSYTLLLLFSTLVTAASLRFVLCPRDDVAAAVRTMAGLAVSGVLAAYTHYFGFLLAGAACAVCGAASLGDRRRTLLAVGGGVVVAAAFLPWVAYHAHYMSYGTRMVEWIAEFPVSLSLAWFLRLWIGGNAALVVFLAAAGLLLATRAFRRFAFGDAAFAIGLALPVLTLGAALAVSAHTPVVTSRNMMVALPALYLVMAELAAYLAMRWGAAASGVYLALQVALMAQSLPWFYTGQSKEQWRESAAFVLAQPGCDHAVIPVYGDTANYAYLVAKARPGLTLTEIPIGDAAFRLPPPGTCPVILWAAKLSPWELDALLSRLGLDRASVQVVTFYWAYVVVRKAP